MSSKANYQSGPVDHIETMYTQIAEENGADPEIETSLYHLPAVTLSLNGGDVTTAITTRFGNGEGYEADVDVAAFYINETGEKYSWHELIGTGNTPGQLRKLISEAYNTADDLELGDILEKPGYNPGNDDPI